MATTNTHWYSINEGISYPLDDQATGVTDAGDRLPSNILVDAHFRWPESFGKYAFISSITVNKNLVTLTFQVSSDLNATVFNPLGVVTLRQPVVENRHYALRPILPGAGGWIVFGSGVLVNSDEDVFSGKFSYPYQSFLAPRTAKPYRSPLVTEVTTPASTEVINEGVVYLKFLPPLYGYKDQRVVGGQLRDVIVIGMKELVARGNSASAVIGNPSTPATQSLFRLFAGPCGGRPESDSCADGKVGIQFINGVGPNCDGEIILKFLGCARVSKIDTPTKKAIVLECDKGLSGFCPPLYLPDNDGKLPIENIIPSSPIDYFDVPPASNEDNEPDIPPSGGNAPSFPHLQCFADCSVNNFVVRSGSWNTENITNNIDNWRIRCEATPPPSMCVYKSLSQSLRNISVWDIDIDTKQRYYETHLHLHIPTNSSGIVKANGGIVLNCRPKHNNPALLVFHVVLVDYDTQRLSLLRFDGTNFHVISQTNVFGIALDTWYQLSVTVQDVSASLASFIINFKSLANTAIDVTMGPLTATYKNSHLGKSGFFTSQAITYFSYWYVDEV